MPMGILYRWGDSQEIGWKWIWWFNGKFSFLRLIESRFQFSFSWQKEWKRIQGYCWASVFHSSVVVCDACVVGRHVNTTFLWKMRFKMVVEIVITRFFVLLLILISIFSTIAIRFTAWKFCPTIVGIHLLEWRCHWISFLHRWYTAGKSFKSFTLNLQTDQKPFLQNNGLTGSPLWPVRVGIVTFVNSATVINLS